MSGAKILVCVDFDKTIVDSNTDSKIPSVINKKLPDEIKALESSSEWTAYMREVFKFLYENGVTKDDYVNFLTQLPLVEGMQELLLQMYESGDCEIVIISDANSFFIETILDHHQLKGIISTVYTNPADFDKEGCLQIKEYQNQATCSRCPHNMCKGSILISHLSKRALDHVKFCRILYIGDGGNDVCGALKLEANDYVFARLGHRLLRSLEKMPARDVKASIIPWENAYDIKNVLLSS